MCDILLILENPSQESKSMERRIHLRAHSCFHSVHNVLRRGGSPVPILHHSESDTRILFICLWLQITLSGVQTDKKEGTPSVWAITNWLTVAGDSLYTAIDLISQLILVRALTYELFSTHVFPLLNEVLPMLDHMAPTIGSGYPGPFLTCVFGC